MEPDLGRPPGRHLPAAFFDRRADQVAPDLVGKVLWREGVGGGRLVEVEAYLPDEDPACHAHRGMTPRNRAMFGAPGTMYVYVSYGIHLLLNLVCLAEGVGSAVLVRAFEPMGDPTVLLANRGLSAHDVRVIASGPGRVGQALSLDLSLNSVPLGVDSGLSVIDNGCRPPVEATHRIGITSGRDLTLRYILPESPYLSRGPRRGREVRR
jgi:DNA-3-methyladenine glycosylase